MVFEKRKCFFPTQVASISIRPRTRGIAFLKNYVLVDRLFNIYIEQNKRYLKCKQTALILGCRKDVQRDSFSKMRFRLMRTRPINLRQQVYRVQLLAII